MLKNLQELQSRCQEIEGLSVAVIAKQLDIPIPESLQRAKGWLGQLIETYLGASGGSYARHDFPELGIELKTIPITSSGTPIESTYVCTVHSNEANIEWRESWVYKKLSKVLWIPIEAEAPLADRVVNQPILWNMDQNSEAILRADWEELMEIIQLGNAHKITASFGEYLHIRPKAANSKVRVDYIDSNGQKTKIVPKGFYLRQAFTRKIIAGQKTCVA